MVMNSEAAELNCCRRFHANTLARSLLEFAMNNYNNKHNHAARNVKITQLENGPLGQLQLVAVRFWKGGVSELFL